MNRFFLLILIVTMNAPLWGQIISSVQYEGIKKTKLAFVEKLSILSVGDSLSDERIEKEIQNFRRVPSFANLYIKVEKDSLGNNRLQYTFEENKTILPEFAFWTQVRQTAFRLGLSEHNFLGQNVTVGGFYQNNGFHSGGFQVQAPFLWNACWGLGGGWYHFESEEPLYFNDSQFDYRYVNKGVELNTYYRPTFNHAFTVGINFFEEIYDALEPQSVDGLPTFAQKEKTLLKFSYTYDNLNFFYYLVDGIRVSSIAQQMLNEKFQIGWIDFSYFKQVEEKGNWAGRLHMGLSTNNNSPFAPFALDNNINIRGVGNAIDRGTAVISANLEYRYTVLERDWFVFQLNAFSDIGTWRNPGGDFSDFIEYENVKWYSGIGVRLIHKFIFGATLRIDYGWDMRGLDGGGFVFGVGQYF